MYERGPAEVPLYQHMGWDCRHIHRRQCTAQTHFGALILPRNQYTYLRSIQRCTDRLPQRTCPDCHTEFRCTGQPCRMSRRRHSKRVLRHLVLVHRSEASSPVPSPANKSRRACCQHRSDHCCCILPQYERCLASAGLARSGSPGTSVALVAIGQTQGNAARPCQSACSRRCSSLSVGWLHRNMCRRQLCHGLAARTRRSLEAHTLQRHQSGARTLACTIRTNFQCTRRDTRRCRSCTVRRHSR